VREPIPSKSDINKSGVLVQGFQQNSFHVFRKEVVGEADIGDLLVLLEGINEVDEPSIIEATR